jgi:hypothetical protein
MKAYVVIPMNTTVQSWSLGFNFSTSLESFEVCGLVLKIQQINYVFSV